MKRLKNLRAVLTVPNLVALGVLGTCALLGWWLLSRSGLDFSTPALLLQSVADLGWGGVLLYIGLLTLAIVISPIPGTPLTVAGGAVWGPVPAALYSIVGLFVGSLIAYFIGRTLGRSAMQALTGKVIYFSKHRGEIYLGWVMFITHLVPIFPCDLMSYGAGVSGMSLPLYASTTLLGMVPCTFFLAYMGSTVRLSLLTGALVVIALIVGIGAIAWLAKRYRWLSFRDVIRME